MEWRSRCDIRAMLCFCIWKGWLHCMGIVEGARDDSVGARVELYGAEASGNRG